MEFKEVYKDLIINKKVRRRGWADRTLYLQINDECDIKCYRQECIIFNYDLSILDEDWFIVGEDERMSFADSISHLLNGEKIKLKDWPNDCFLESSENRKFLYMRKNWEFDFTPSFECFSENDWEVIDDQ